MSRKHRELMALCFSSALGLIAMNGLVSQSGYAQESKPPTNHPNPNVPPGAPGTGEKPPLAPQDPTSGYLIAPAGSETLTEPLAENTMHLYAADDFGGVKSELSAIGTTFTAGAMNEIPAGLKDGLTSLRWNLAPGVVVVFYEDGSGKGEQLAIWGKGQAPTVGKWDFNDKASRWAWYHIGGGRNAPSAESMILPHGATPSADVTPENSVQFFIDTKFGNDMHQVSPVTGNKSGELQRLPAAIGDSLSSLRWNLPAGVIVTMYQDADGTKQQTSVWGSGQIADLDAWDFNDKASRWTWAYVGVPKGSSNGEDRKDDR